MMKIFKIILVLIVLNCLSCSNNKGINSEEFLNKIIVQDWDKKTYSFLKENCIDSLNDFSLNDKAYANFITKEKDTITTLNEQLKLYLKHRRNIISKLIEKKNLVGEFIDTLVISENYLGSYNYGNKISYIVSSNDMDSSIIFYFKLDKFEKLNKMHPESLLYNYSSILLSEPKCIVESTKAINDVSFETVFYYNKKDSTIVSELKNGVLSFSKIH